MASAPTPRSRTKSTIPGALLVGLGATLVVPGAAQADPDPEPTAASGPPLSKLDAGDQALARHAQADRPTPAPVKPTPPVSPTNAGTPPGDRTGNPANYSPSPVATPSAKPKKPKVKASTPPPGDRTDRGGNYTPKPTPKPKAKKPAPRESTPPPGDRTDRGNNYTPAASTPAKPPRARKPAPAPKPVKAAPTRPGSPAGDRTANPANYTPSTPAPTQPGSPAGDRTANPANYEIPKAAPTKPGAPAGDRTGDPGNYAPTPVTPGAPAGDRTGRLANYPSTPVGTPPPGDRTGDGRDYPAPEPAPKYDPRQLVDANGDVINVTGKPDLGGATPPGALSFPGNEGERDSVSVTCSASPKAKPNGGLTATGTCNFTPSSLPGVPKGKHRAGKNGLKVDVTYTTTAGRTPNTMTPAGERATVQVTSETVTKAGGEAELKKLNVSYRRISNGRKTIYQITSTPARIAQISENGATAPNAKDPTTIKPGDTLLISQENFEGHEGKVGVDHVQTEASKVEGGRQSAGVQYVRKGVIRITVGDEKFVRTLLRAGVGTDTAALGIYSSGDQSKGKLRQVDLDVSTKRGWEEYQRFIATGRVKYRPGLPFNLTDRQSWDTTNGLYGKLGPLELTTTGSHGTGDLRRVRNSDGSVDEVTTVSSDKATFYRKDKTNADGTKAPTEGYLLLENASSKEVREYRDRTGGTDESDGKIDGKGSDIKVRFTEQDLDTLRDVAVKRIQRTTADLTGEDAPTRKQVLDGSREARPDLPQLATEWNIVNAKSPVERLYALYQGQGGRNDQLFDILLDRNPQNDGETPVPGRATVLGD